MKRLGIAALLAFVLVACSEAGAADGPIVLREYAIDVPAGQFAAGALPLEIVNQGEFSHTLVVTAADGRAIAATETIAPGDATELVLDLPPGTYHVSCRIVVQLPDGTIVDHYQSGMLAEFTVAGADG